MDKVLGVRYEAARGGDQVQVEDKSAAELISRNRGVWSSAVAVAFLAAILLWPAFLNGGPFFMADTPSYVRGAASAAYKLFHMHTDWADEYIRVYGNFDVVGSQPSETGMSPGAAVPVTLKGRSIYYGIFLYVAALAGTLWIAITTQSLIAALCIYTTVELIYGVHNAKPSALEKLLLGAFIVLLTPVAFFTSYLMPDIFGGFGLLSAAILLSFWCDISRLQKLFWTILLGYSLLVHSVNLMLFTALILVWVIYASWRGISLNKYQLASLAGCILIGIFGQVSFNHAVKVLTGAPPVTPPFVAMRLIADGPGYAYLQKHCSVEPLIYCRVLGRRDLHHDDLLWSNDPKISLFRGLPADEQRISASQQLPFITAVFADQPASVSVTALRNSIDQLFSLDLKAFNYSSGNISRFRNTIPAEMFRGMTQTRAFRNKMPISAMEALTVLTVIFSCLVVFWFIASRPRGAAKDRLRNLCLILLTGIALNAVICGALSGPKGRYEMRLIWVLPLVAGAIASTHLGRRNVIWPSESGPQRAV